MTRDNSTAARDRRRTEAQTRQKAYDALSLEEKVALVATRPGASARETARLAGLK